MLRGVWVYFIQASSAHLNANCRSKRTTMWICLTVCLHTYYLSHLSYMRSSICFCSQRKTNASVEVELN